MMRFFRWLCVYRDIDLSEFLVRMRRLPKAKTRLHVFVPPERRLTWKEQRSRVEEQP
jgi:intergrase/recombinase